MFGLSLLRAVHLVIVAYLESLQSAILSLKAMYRRAVLGTTNLSNGKGNFGSTGPTGQSGPPSKLVPNIPVRPNRNGPFHLMYQPKLPGFWVEWKALKERGTIVLPKLARCCSY